MKKTLLIGVLILFWAVPPGFAEKIMNNNVSVRTMPGAFYPIVTVLNAGDPVSVLTTQKPWKKVKTSGNQVGWVSENAFNSVGNAIDYGAMAMENPDRSLSKIMVTAAVKGFFENKLNDKSLNARVLDNPYTMYIVPSEFNRFYTETYQGRWSHQTFLSKNPMAQQGPFRIDEDLVALSAYICARLAAPGLSNNTALVRYVNNVAGLVMQGTEFYDLPISVHIVKTNEIFANATPIGVIMVSEGMLNVIRNEGELGCLLGHEIAHVTLHHGAAEMAKRKPKINAEDAFAEMNEEFGPEGDELDEVEADLDNLSMDMYEWAVRGRKAEYELAADKRGMIYARRAGYRSDGMISLLSRLKTLIPASRNPEDHSHWMPKAMDDRIAALEKAERKLPENKNYQNFQTRYMRNAR